MKAFLFFLFMLTAALANAQHNIRKAFAYAQPIVAGNPAADEAKHPTVTVSYFALLETAPGKQVTVTQAWIGGRSYSVAATSTPPDAAWPEAGKALKAAAAKPACKSCIIYLQFFPGDSQKKVPASCKKQKAGTILLAIAAKQGSVYYTIQSITQLLADRTRL